MSIIACANDCIYQTDGYCSLDTVTEAPNGTQGRFEGDCVYFQKRGNKTAKQPIKTN